MGKVHVTLALEAGELDAEPGSEPAVLAKQARFLERARQGTRNQALRPRAVLSGQPEKYLVAQELIAWLLRDKLRCPLLEPLGSILVEAADPPRLDRQVDRAARAPVFVGHTLAPKSLRRIGKKRLQPDREGLDVPERPLVIGAGRMSWIIDQQHYAPIRVVLERCGE